MSSTASPLHVSVESPPSSAGAFQSSPAEHSPAPALPSFSPEEAHALSLYAQGYTEQEASVASGLSPLTFHKLLFTNEAQAFLRTIFLAKKHYVDSLEEYQDQAAAESHRLLRLTVSGQVPSGKLTLDGLPELVVATLDQRLKAAQALIDRSKHTARAVRQTIQVRSYASEAMERVNSRFNKALKQGAFSLASPTSLCPSQESSFPGEPLQAEDPSPHPLRRGPSSPLEPPFEVQEEEEGKHHGSPSWWEEGTGNRSPLAEAELEN